MKDRIEEILRYYKLTSSAFADKLGVQRSGISHILSGRNKPSYDFLVSLINEFPEINPSWLMTGKGMMLIDNEEAFSVDGFNQSLSKSLFNRDLSTSNQADKNNLPPTTKVPTMDGYKSKQSESSTKEIESIVVFYSDGSFRRYISD
jgi:predicted transcriptional regulator